MAMEVNAPPKRLVRHTAPIIALAGVLLTLSAIFPGRYDTPGSGAGDAIARGAVTPFVHVRLAPNGSVKLTLGDQAGATPAAGSALNGGIAGAGRDVQLSFNLQASAQ